MQDRFKLRYNYNNKIYDVSAIDFTHSRGEIVSLDKQETLMCKLDLNNLIQCTGLKDKNNNLVYEGDIVGESFGETGTYRVEYFPYSAEWQYVNLDDEKPNWEMFSIQFEGMSENQGISTDLEIIGNIYENPELIGGEQ